ncbi:uncharacterized protein LOC126260736 [Schistocerca nitens]|uniref:uncharacterized protein LOC126260736 n=1 Tax=Schistocerca nitens TaxID=7011 RepID=UPI0021189A7C|nr:uncharacterized protein LOC126260736 [Schistocerca nitens]
MDQQSLYEGCLETVVARMVKFWGVPLLTAGGMTFDYARPKQGCEDEFYLLVRIGTVSFREMAHFVIDIMTEYNWRKVMLVYDKNGYRQVSGNDTCKMYMQTQVEYLKERGMPYGVYDLGKYPEDGDFTEYLRLELQYTYSGDMTFDLDGALFHGEPTIFSFDIHTPGN